MDVCHLGVVVYGFSFTVEMTIAKNMSFISLADANHEPSMMLVSEPLKWFCASFEILVRYPMSETLNLVTVGGSLLVLPL